MGILEDRLAIWDGAEDALTFSSGMTAICILMLAYVSQGDVIVHSGPLYAASEGFVAKVLSKFAKDHEELKITAGAMSGAVLSVSEVQALATPRVVPTTANAKQTRVERALCQIFMRRTLA